MKKSCLTIILCTLALVLSVAVYPKTVQAATIPTFNIVAVEEDKNVTIYTKNFPANKEFKVLMGEFGTKGLGGIEVISINTGSGGSFYGTFIIPNALQGRNLIAIRLQGTDSTYYAYNWFYNGPWESNGGGAVYTGIPTFSISSVVTNSTVSILTNNIPANMDFKVTMGKMGTKGVNGITVTTFNSAAGGSFNATYDIPASLHGDYQIAIRLETTGGDFYAYNWFYNDSSSIPSYTPGYTGIPTFSISAVTKNNTVTIKTNNFPANVDFKVSMGKMGTKGIGGAYVTTTNSGAGGVFSKTYSIPVGLYGENLIAIRLEATSGGYYAFNWFYNNTFP